MKKNNKGFMLAEVFIVSSFVLGVLVYMFVQINSIMKNYNRSFSFDTIPGLYITNEVNNYLKLKDNSGTIISSACSTYQIINFDDDFGQALKKNANIKSALLGNSLYIKENALNDLNISAKEKDYIKYLSTKNSCILILEFNDDTYASLNM